MVEKEFETWICEQLRGERWESLALHDASPGLKTLGDLLRGRSFDIIPDTSNWNTHPGLMQDVIGGMTPDIVLRSSRSGENRILIEVKTTSGLTYGRVDSQVVRYFLHLLAMSRQSAGHDIPRAVILAAPREWFEVAHNRDDWNHFKDRYAGLAEHFGIALAVLYAPPKLG